MARETFVNQCSCACHCGRCSNNKYSQRSPQSKGLNYNYNEGDHFTQYHPSRNASDCSRMQGRQPLLDDQTVNTISGYRQKACRFINSETDVAENPDNRYRPDVDYDEGSDVEPSFVKKALEVLKDYEPQSSFLRKIKQKYLQPREAEELENSLTQSICGSCLLRSRQQGDREYTPTAKAQSFEPRDRFGCHNCSRGFQLSCPCTKATENYNENFPTQSIEEICRTYTEDDLQCKKSFHISRSKKPSKTRARRKRKSEVTIKSESQDQFEPSLKKPHENSCERCWRYASPSRSPVNKPDQRYDPNFRKAHSCMTLASEELANLEVSGKHISPCKNLQPLPPRTKETTPPPTPPQSNMPKIKKNQPLELQLTQYSKQTPKSQQPQGQINYTPTEVKELVQTPFRAPVCTCPRSKPIEIYSDSKCPHRIIYSDTKQRPRPRSYTPGVSNKEFVNTPYIPESFAIPQYKEIEQMPKQINQDSSRICLRKPVCREPSMTKNYSSFLDDFEKTEYREIQCKPRRLSFESTGASEGKSSFREPTESAPNNINTTRQNYHSSSRSPGNKTRGSPRTIENVNVSVKLPENHMSHTSNSPCKRQLQKNASFYEPTAVPECYRPMDRSNPPRESMGNQHKLQKNASYLEPTTVPDCYGPMNKSNPPRESLANQHQFQKNASCFDPATVPECYRPMDRSNPPRESLGNQHHFQKNASYYDPATAPECYRPMDRSNPPRESLGNQHKLQKNTTYLEPTTVPDCYGPMNRSNLPRESLANQQQFQKNASYFDPATAPECYRPMDKSNLPRESMGSHASNKTTNLSRHSQRHESCVRPETCHSADLNNSNTSACPTGQNVQAQNGNTWLEIPTYSEKIQQHPDFSISTIAPPSPRTSTGRGKRISSPRTCQPTQRTVTSTPKSHRTKPVTPKTHTPKSATPKSRTPKSSTPKSRTPKSCTPKSCTPKSCTPKSRTPKSSASKTQSPKWVTPKSRPANSAPNSTSPLRPQSPKISPQRNNQPSPYKCDNNDNVELHKVSIHNDAPSPANNRTFNVEKSVHRYPGPPHPVQECQCGPSPQKTSPRNNFKQNKEVYCCHCIQNNIPRIQAYNWKNNLEFDEEFPFQNLSQTYTFGNGSDSWDFAPDDNAQNATYNFSYKDIPVPWQNREKPCRQQNLDFSDRDFISSFDPEKFGVGSIFSFDSFEFLEDPAEKAAEDNNRSGVNEKPPKSVHDSSKHGAMQNDTYTVCARHSQGAHQSNPPIYSPRKYTVFYMTKHKEGKKNDVEVLVEELTQKSSDHKESKKKELEEKLKKVTVCPSESMALRFQKGVFNSFKNPPSSRILYF